MRSATTSDVRRWSFLKLTAAVLAAVALLPLALVLLGLIVTMLLPAAVVGLPFLVSALFANVVRLPNTNAPRISMEFRLPPMHSASVR